MWTIIGKWGVTGTLLGFSTVASLLAVVSIQDIYVGSATVLSIAMVGGIGLYNAVRVAKRSQDEADASSRRSRDEADSHTLKGRYLLLCQENEDLKTALEAKDISLRAKDDHIAILQDQLHGSEGRERFPLRAKDDHITSLQSQLHKSEGTGTGTEAN